jgi:phosphoglucosamine mutase
MLEAALIAGITSAGGDALVCGIVPTPAAALLTRELGANGAAVISASHNPAEYNGIKFFDKDGYKLTHDVEDAFESFLHGDAADDSTEPPCGSALGRVTHIDDAAERYISHATATIQSGNDGLAGLNVVVDCGHGASATTTPEALKRLGANVVVLNPTFNGDDINDDSGSTHPEQLARAVLENGADVGIAHDGDADRTIAVDEAGNLVDGDMIEAICARDMLDRGVLAHDTVVTTVMCNLGFTIAMRDLGINVVQTPVGDSNVLQAMLDGGFIIGGEQSGHTIFLEHNSTGDGLITALQLLSVMARSEIPLSRLARVMRRYPQALVNVKVKDKQALDASLPVSRAIEDAQGKLDAAGAGRILVRASGTEPLIRVMVEASDEAMAQQVAGDIARVVESELG